MNPLLALTALAAHVKHVDAELVHGETSLVYTGGLCTGAQNIHFIGKVFRVADTINLVKEASGALLAKRHSQTCAANRTAEYVL